MKNYLKQDVIRFPGSKHIFTNHYTKMGWKEIRFRSSRIMDIIK
jgi:hypothetical protein